MNCDGPCITGLLPKGWMCDSHVATSFGPSASTMATTTSFFANGSSSVQHDANSGMPIWAVTVLATCATAALIVVGYFFARFLLKRNGDVAQRKQQSHGPEHNVLGNLEMSGVVIPGNGASSVDYQNTAADSGATATRKEKQKQRSKNRKRSKHLHELRMREGGLSLGQSIGHGDEVEDVISIPESEPADQCSKIPSSSSNGPVTIRNMDNTLPTSSCEIEEDRTFATLKCIALANPDLEVCSQP